MGYILLYTVLSLCIFDLSLASISTRSKHSILFIRRMCGIWACLGVVRDAKDYIRKLEARGPEGMKVVDLSGNITFGFTRLAINGLTDAGMQPYSSGPLTWMCNGEIYNSKQLEEDLGLESAGSDCHCIGELYMRHRDDLATFARSLDGVFGLILYDAEREILIVARDPYGVRPLFVGTNFCNDTTVFSSEIKGINMSYDKVEPVSPGTVRIYSRMQGNKFVLKELVKYHTTPWITNPQFTPLSITGRIDAAMALRFALEESVYKRMLTDRPVAALLSGGLDSSLIASLVQMNLKQTGQSPLKTFSIGFAGSSDLKYARVVADWIGSDHTEIVATADEFFEAIPEVIKAIESYDTTTVRASVGNYLVAKKIRELTDCKVVFNGDGSDELFGGYLYFNNAPNDQAFHAETERLLENIHTFDVLRSDRSISANGLEARTPFLDKQFVALVRSIHPSFLRPQRDRQVEKALLREAFDDGVTLPDEALWRRKEAFSDGVSGPEKAWYEEIQERVSRDSEEAQVHFDYMDSKTPEDYYYRTLYRSFYGDTHCRATVPYKWMPRWCPETDDPSARTLAVYDDDSKS